MYPFDSLPANLAAFCAWLRREHAFRIGPRDLHDAARALTQARLTDERRVRDTLRPILCSTVHDVTAFDDLFRAFFQGGAHGARQESPQPAWHSDLESDVEQPDGKPRRGSSRVATIESMEGAGEGSEVVLRASYSPLEGEGASPDLAAADSEWRQAASALVRRLEAGLSRKWRPAPRGQRFDFRRTLRASLHTGGEALIPRWQARPKRRPRFVLLIDGSRSMHGHAQHALQAAVAIAEVARDVEVFTFSTSIRRITRDVRRAIAGTRGPLPHLRHAWGGGTSIGGCLREFLRTAGSRLLGREVFAIIASDGLDVGSPEILREAMAEIHRRTAGVIWLNPLLATAGYEPTALGMSVARPYVTTLACANDAAGLRQLARLVRARA